MPTEIDQAAAGIAAGELVVYPTETVYGLGADALDPTAVERVFEAKYRDRSKPVSMGVSDIESALEYVRATRSEKSFMREFLPGPYTVVLERKPAVPDVLTAGRNRVGIRIPDHDLARELARLSGPVTATSANISGSGSARRVAEVDDEIRERAGVVLDRGETPGGGSTVVDVANETIHRRGAGVTAVEEWFAER